jgi:hypothetical protein
VKHLAELFEISYGNKLDLNKMQPCPISRGGVHFVGRSSENRGVTATVARLPQIKPYESGLLTVALGGQLLSTFVQETPFYTAQNVAVLKPKIKMTFEEKVFVCLCIRHNRFRYSPFGREANRSLKALEIPVLEEFPEWARKARDVGQVMSHAKKANGSLPLEVRLWKGFQLQELFEIRKGKRLTKADMVPGNTPFIGAIDSSNGLAAFIGQGPIHEGNTITVNYNGNGVAEAFYQPRAFWCSDDVNVLYPKFQLNPAIALFLTTIIRREKFRYSYGRKWDLVRMNPSVIRLPVTSAREPDWEYMERFTSSLPFSSQLD